MQESIFSLAYAVNISHKELDRLAVPIESRPTHMARIEVNLTAFLCVFCQGFCSWLLLQDFLLINNKIEDGETLDF